ncbi:DUF4352 domain-containing protein [Streptomyces sp. NPDC004838]
MSHSMQQPQYGDSTQPGQYGQYGPQWGGPAQTPPEPPARKGVTLTALILGVLGIVTAPIPFVFWLGGTLGLVALIVGLSGRSKYGKAASTVGAALGVVAMVLAIVGAVLTFKVMDDAVDEFDKSIRDISASAEPSGAAGSDDKGKAKGKGGDGEKGGLGAGDASAYKDGLKVTVSAPKSFTPSEVAAGHTAGNKAYKVTVVIENTGTKKFDSTLVLADARAGADGVTAEQIFDQKVDSSFDGMIMPGKKATVTFGFSAPADAKNLTVEITPGFDHDPAQWELTV